MLSPQIINEIDAISIRLNVNSGELTKLIDFESGFDPQAKNPHSSARGLIQFIDSTARELGYDSSLDLVTKHPTIEDQLADVENYLTNYFPFRDKQDLYMSVFYPKYRRYPAYTVFPEHIREDNPGIDTIQDYVNLVDRKEKVKIGAFAGIALLLLLFYILNKGR